MKSIKLLFASLALCTVTLVQAQSPIKSFYTPQGYGPDKWASAWLLTRYVYPGSTIQVVKEGESVEGAVPFDIKGETYYRELDQSMFQVIANHHNVDDEVMAEFAQLIYQIEVNFWSNQQSPSANAVESAYRRLQYQYDPASISPECYVTFFDRVYAYLKSVKQNQPVDPQVVMDVMCEDVDTYAASRTALVPELPLRFLLGEMASGKKVVFVDVREPEEYAEGHIPGAVNLPIRDINDDSIAEFKNADYVVSYCVKDFRGFEAARTIKQSGISQSVILKPYGIKGWKEAGLPVAGDKALAKTDANIQLKQCVAAPAQCLKSKGEE